jgi:hypothetical protein
MRALLRGKGLQIVIWYDIALAEVMLLIFGAGLVLLVALNTRTFLDLRTGTIAALCVIVAFAWAALMIEIAKVMKRKTSITPTFEDDLERTYRVPIEDLWELWTTKAGFESWWGPEGFASRYTPSRRARGARSSTT